MVNSLRDGTRGRLPIWTCIPRLSDSDSRSELKHPVPKVHRQISRSVRSLASRRLPPQRQHTVDTGTRERGRAASTYTMQESGGASGGASRTFHSIFRSSARRGEDADTADVDGVDHIDGGDLINRIRTVQKSEREEEDEELWDEDFPGDGNENNNELVDGTTKMERQGTLATTLNTSSARSIEDWADHDDEEDAWKDALQSRVDQLELVVEKKIELDAPSTDITSPPPAPIDGYNPPVDQRATLTLLPKTNLTRSISDPISVVDEKRASKLKTPTVPRTVSAVASSQIKQAVADSGAAKPGVEQRKRSNSKDFSARHPHAGEHKRLSKSSSATGAAGANSVFVRAVVARGSHPVSRTQEVRVGDGGHVDKRSKSDEHAPTVALSDAETVRRYILNDLKKMSVERIVSDAKRLHFLEDLYRRQPDASERKLVQSGPNTANPVASHASPAKKRAI